MPIEPCLLLLVMHPPYPHQPWRLHRCELLTHSFNRPLLQIDVELPSYISAEIVRFQVISLCRPFYRGNARSQL